MVCRNVEDRHDMGQGNIHDSLVEDDHKGAGYGNQYDFPFSRLGHRHFLIGLLYSYLYLNGGTGDKDVLSGIINGNFYGYDLCHLDKVSRGVVLGYK
jgi:hypothetical protein